MTTPDITSMKPVEDVRSLSTKLAKTLAKKIAIGLVVSVVVTIATNAIVEAYETAKAAK